MTQALSTPTAPALSHYSEVLRRVKAAGLLRKSPAFYIRRVAITSAASLVAWGLVVLASRLGWVWVAFPTMAVLGILAAQFGFVAHEASHRQVFHSNRANDWAGRVLANLFAGLSYGFWMRKHNRHHAKPNQVGADPDIAIRVLSFTTESLEAKRGPERAISKRQGWLFPFLLLLTGFDLLLDSILAVARRGGGALRHRVLEFALMFVRQAAPIVIVFLLFPPHIAGPLWLIQMLTFGLFMGGAFAPNHKGMPLVAHDAKIDFFERQVLTSRNIRTSWFTDNLMGGLNFQVEHHLFPSMARPQLRQAHVIVARYCREVDVKLTETGFLASYRIVIRYLNEVGLSTNADPFVCPMVAQLRPRN